ncbi:MAG: 50S ribosomal protein L19 [bacterium]|nr:50S ribosomal protein L19 [bacterium]
MALADINIEQRKKWDLRPGNTVRVWQKIREGEKTRLQAFEGLIIAHKHGFESGATFTVRKISGGIGVERIFPVFSPNIDKIEIVKRSKARRAKLYYIREKTAKQIRRKMKQLRNIVSGGKEEEEEIVEEPKPEAVDEPVDEVKAEEETKTEEGAEEKTAVQEEAAEEKEDAQKEDAEEKEVSQEEGEVKVEGEKEN